MAQRETQQQREHGQGEHGHGEHVHGEHVHGEHGQGEHVHGEHVHGEHGQPEGDQVEWRGRTWITAAYFGALALIFYAPIVLQLRAFPDGDFVHHFFPFAVFQREQLAAGQLAVWNPYTYGGHPFLADVQAALFYPISNLIILLSLPVKNAAVQFYLLEIEAVVHTALAGWFAYLWLRDLTGSRWGGVMGGTLFALSGYVTGYAPLQLAVLRTAVWLPLLLWCLGRGWQRPRQWRWWLGAVLALSAAFLGGHSQSFMLLGYAAAAWTLVLFFTIRPWRVHACLAALGVVAIAVGLTAAQWLPSIEFVKASVRANVDYAFVSGGLGWADFWQLVLPRVLTQYSPLYAGAIGIILAVIALLTLWQPAPVEEAMQPRLLPWRAGIWFGLGLMLFALLAALGGNGPLYPLLYRVAPGWAWFRGQERAAYLVALALSALAAYGMAALPNLSLQVRRRGAWLAGALVLAVVYAFGLLWQLPGRTAIDHVHYLMIAGMTLLLALTVVVLVTLPGWSMRRGAWLVALAVVNLVWANGGTNQVPGTPRDRVRVAPEVLAVMDAVAARPDVANGLPGRVYNEFRAYDDYGMRAHVEDVWGSSPLRVARYAALFDQFPLDRMWRLLGVEHVLTWRRELFGPSELLGEFPQSTDTTYLHRLPSVNPRAWLVPQAVALPDDEALALLADHHFDLDLRGILGTEVADSFAAIESGDALSGTVTLARASAADLAVVVESERDALLVVSETWLPGWQVTSAQCGGAACPTQDAAGRAYFAPMRTDLTLVGIWLPAGSSTFTLRYQPRSIQAGLWISAATLVLLLVAGAWRGWGGRTL